MDARLSHVIDASGALSNTFLTLHHGPTRVLILAVVLVVPNGGATLAQISGNGDEPRGALLFAVSPLSELGVAGSAAPIALDSGAGFTQI